MLFISKIERDWETFLGNFYTLSSSYFQDLAVSEIEAWRAWQLGEGFPRLFSQY
jgi:hypothetical protein